MKKCCMIIKEVIHMVYEMRIYHIAAGKRKELENRFQNVTFSLLEKHGIEVCDYWLGEEGKTLCYICRFSDSAMRNGQWEAFKTDPEWIAAKAKSEEKGALVDKIESYLVVRPDYIRPLWKE